MSDARVVFGPDHFENWILAESDRITRRGRGPLPEGATAHPTPDAAITAGAVNAHTHLYSGLAPLGMPPAEPPPENFLQILERRWWRLDRALDAASLTAAARLYVAESLLAGTTLLVDHHESPELIEGSLDLLADACQELGVRALLCYGATERNGGRDEARRGLAECRRFFESNTRPLVRGVVGLHASFTVSDDTIRDAGALCRELETVLHVHVAEDASDVEDARRRGYEGPLQRLEKLDALPEGSILAHGVHLTPEQVQRAGDVGCWLVQNPRSNEGNGVGFGGVLGTSPRALLGTDGYPADLEAESAALARLGGDGGPQLAAARRDATHAFRNEVFARHFGMGDDAATVADARAVGLKGGPPPLVMVAGRIVVENGILAGADLAAVRGEAAARADELWARMRRNPA